MPLLRLNENVPNFSCSTQLGELSFHSYIENKWCLFFAHPANFTPICTTEFGVVSKLKKEFKLRDCKILGLSIDTVENHKLWISDINETQDTAVNFPIVADVDGKIASKFCFATQTKNSNASGIESRVLYLINPEKKIKLALEYPSNVGRNFNEILRILDALRLAEIKPIGTPANWKLGGDVVILPEIDDEEAKQEFENGFTALKPYLRITSSSFFKQTKQK